MCDIYTKVIWKFCKRQKKDKMTEQNLKGNLAAEMQQQPQQNHHRRQPSVAAATAAIAHSSKMNKKDSILESIYLSFGYKPPNKEELYQLVCKYKESRFLCSDVFCKIHCGAQVIRFFFAYQPATEPRGWTLSLLFSI